MHTQDVSLPKGKASPGAILTEAAQGAAKALSALKTEEDLATAGVGAAGVVTQAQALCEQVCVCACVCALVSVYKYEYMSAIKDSDYR